MDNSEIYKSKKELLKFLDIKENFLYSDFNTKYKEIEKIKKNGGIRRIKPPSPNLKKVQRKILDDILYKNTQLECVYGLSKNKGILNNAKKHQENFNKQLLVLDIETFFPSISKDSINKVFKKIGFNKENSSILTKLCTVGDSLPQGAPTSPYLASMVCLKLDKEIYLYSKKRNLIYTRYFDDISVSGENISINNISSIEKIIHSHGFKCNSDKKRFFDSSDDKIINSVVISKLGLSVSETYKEEIRIIYRQLAEDKSISNQRLFRGKFGFYLYINKKEALNFIKNI